MPVALSGRGIGRSTVRQCRPHSAGGHESSPGMVDKACTPALPAGPGNITDSRRRRVAAFLSTMPAIVTLTPHKLALLVLIQLHAQLQHQHDRVSQELLFLLVSAIKVGCVMRVHGDVTRRSMVYAPAIHDDERQMTPHAPWPSPMTQETASYVEPTFAEFEAKLQHLRPLFFHDSCQEMGVAEVLRERVPIMSCVRCALCFNIHVRTT